MGELLLLHGTEQSWMTDACFLFFRRSNYTGTREDSCKVRPGRTLALVRSSADVHLCCVDTCAGMKKNPLACVPVWKRRDALSTLWRQVALFAHFEREETLFWNPRRAQCLRVVYPGECFLRDSGKLLEGLWYEDQVQRHTLEVKCIPGMMCPERIVEDDQGADPS